MSLVKQRILVFLFPLLLSLPFINRAYFVDDSYFVEIAEWLKENPGRPYEFKTDDAGIGNLGWEKDGFVRMVNPLAHHYYLAFLLKIGGEREWFLRLGCLLLVCFSGLFVFGLAQRWVARPLLTTFLIQSTPVHWATAHSLLIDATLFFWFMGALYFYVRAMESASWQHIVGSGLFMGMAVLTKYPGLLLLPLTALYWLLNRRRLKWRLMYAVPWIVAIGFLTGYSLYTASLYGSPHILAASSRMVRVFSWPKALVLFVFFSAGTIAPLVGWTFLSARKFLISGLIVFIFSLILGSSLGGYPAIQAFLISFWLVTSVLFLFVYAASRSEWSYPLDPFLFLWVVGFLVLMFIAIGWVAARYYLIVLPAVVFMAVRLIYRHRSVHAPRRLLSILLLGTMAVSSAVVYADYRQAETSRLIVKDLRNQGFYGGPRHYYVGDSFTVSYLREEGWIPSFPETTFEPGDFILAKEVTMPGMWLFKKDLTFVKIAEFSYPTRFPVKVMDYRGSAGFYASLWGALPFTLSTGPWERFHLLMVTDSRAGRGRVGW